MRGMHSSSTSGHYSGTFLDKQRKAKNFNDNRRFHLRFKYKAGVEFNVVACSPGHPVDEYAFLQDVTSVYFVT
jgi:hypothetical protein